MTDHPRIEEQVAALRVLINRFGRASQNHYATGMRADTQELAELIETGEDVESAIRAALVEERERAEQYEADLWSFLASRTADHGDVTFCPPMSHGGDPNKWLVAIEDLTKSVRGYRHADEFEAATPKEALATAIRALRERP